MYVKKEANLWLPLRRKLTQLGTHLISFLHGYFAKCQPYFSSALFFSRLLQSSLSMNLFHAIYSLYGMKVPYSQVSTIWT